MWPFNWLRTTSFGSKKKTRRPRSPACALHADRLMLRGRRDAAVTRHWANADGLVRAYKDIRVSGRTSGGGRVEMLRREGRILDYDGNSMFALNRAYGFGQARIA